MESERIELLQSLKTYLSEGVLSVEKFPQKHVIEVIRNEYDSWLSEKRCQLEEYLNIYNVLMNLAVEKGDCIQLSAFLDELICDMKMTSINSCGRLDSLRSMMDDAVIECYRQGAREAYKRYGCRSTSGETSFKGRGVIYTVITGEYDELQEPLYISPEFDYICFTDNKSLRSKIWDIRYIENSEVDNVRLARKHKILCHKFLDGYDFSVYIDGKIQIVGDLNKYIKTYSVGSPMLCFPHFVRNCVYEEAEACIQASKDDPGIIIRQMEEYRKEGYPVNNGLIDSACLVRWHNDRTLQKVLECWWKEVKERSKRDQLSIGYVCWKNNFHYDMSDLFIYQNEYIRKKRSWELPY